MVPSQSITERHGHREMGTNFMSLAGFEPLIHTYSTSLLSKDLEQEVDNLDM